MEQPVRTWRWELFLLGFVAAWVVGGIAIWLWPSLPDRIPMHFNGSGVVTRWGSRSEWILLAALGGAMPLLIGALAAALPMMAVRWPNSVNLPDNSFRTAPPELRAWAVAPMAYAVSGLSLALAGLFGFLLYGTARVASGAWTTLPSAAFWVIVPAIIGMMLVGVAFCTMRSRSLRALTARG